MGSYIHVGLVVRASAAWDDRGDTIPSDDERAGWFREQGLEPGLFDLAADQHTAVWTLQPQWLGESLVGFLREQDRIAQLGGSMLKERQELYERLLALSSWEEVTTLAEEGRYFDFHLWSEYERRRRWEPGPREADFTLLVYLSEGKAFLECWTTFFRYLEHMIGLQADRFPIARAAKLAIG